VFGGGGGGGWGGVGFLRCWVWGGVQKKNVTEEGIEGRAISLEELCLSFPRVGGENHLR